MKPTSDTPSPEGKTKSIIFFFLRIAIACGIIVWLVHGDTATVIEKLKTIELSWLALALLFYAFHLAFGAYRWLLLIRVQGINISYAEVLSLWMQGFFFSLVIPGGALGGDLIKAKFLSAKMAHGEKLEATFTILMDRIVGLMGMFSVAAAFIVLNYESLIQMSSFNQSIIGAITLAVVVGLSASCVIFFHRTFEKIPGVKAVLMFVDSKAGGVVSRLMTAMDYYRSAYKRIITLIVLTVVFIHLNLGVLCSFLGRGISDNPAGIKASITAVTLGNVASLVPGTQGGVGTRDYVMKTLFELGGVVEADALAMTLLFTAVILTYSILGGLFYIFPVASSRQDKEGCSVES